jgi:hypothetical protein
MITWRKERAGGHGRPKWILRDEDAVCDVCNEERTCLGFDASEEEYNTIWICEFCAHLGFCGDDLPGPSLHKRPDT